MNQITKIAPTERARQAGYDAGYEDGKSVAYQDVSAAFLTAQEVARLARVHIETLLVWRNSDRGPRSFKIGGSVRYLRDDVEQWMTAAGVTARTEPTQAAGPVECATWCQFGDGHANERFVEDQACHTAELRVPLSLEPLIPDDDFDEATGQWIASPDYVEVYGTRHVGEAPQIRYSHAGGPEVRYTPDEARQLVEAMQLLLGQIGQSS